MKVKIPQSLSILIEACKKFNYSYELIDKYSNNLLKVSSGKKHFFASNSRLGIYPLNYKFSAELVSDKAWAYKLLKEKKYKIPKGEYFFLKNEYRYMRGDGREFLDALAFAKDKYPIFVKPNNSSLGILADLIYNEKDLKRHLIEISKNSHIAIIQEFINLPEYRIFVVNGDIEFIYERKKAKIIGDGKTVVKNLIDQLNLNIELKKNKISKKSTFIKKQLKDNKISIKSVLKLGKVIKVASKSNISAGGSINNYSEEVSDDVKIWVKKLIKDLSINVCGIDIFVDGSINNPDNFIVIEINHNPGLSALYNLGYKDKVFDIWKKILQIYFN